MAEAQERWTPRANLWLIAASVMLPAIMEVLDTTMANVALPNIAGSLSASQEESTWALTSYLVSNAIILPMTDWLCVRFGRKRFLMFCVVSFTLASAWCGFAGSLHSLILARIVQGAAGGGLIPLSQAILMESAPMGKRGLAMAIFGMGVVVAPVIGPVLGGYLTDNYSWRWMFFINIPVGVLALFMCQAFIEDPPYLAEAKKRSGPVDYIGFGLMSLSLSTLQIVLDKGQQEDWLEAPWIAWLSVVCVATMAAFIVWELRAKHPMVNLRVFANRNFAIGTLLMTLVGVTLFATITLQPLFMQTLMGYSALDSGMALSPRGIGSFISMIVVGMIVGKIDNRLIMGVCFCVLSYASFTFGGVNLDITQANVVWPNLIMGLSLGLFVPLSTTALGGLPQELVGAGSGLFNLMRNIGGSIGIALVMTLLARDTQFHQNMLAANFYPSNPRFQEYLQGVTSYLSRTCDPVLAKQKALALLQGVLSQQASLLAYLDEFRLMGWISLACILGVLLLGKQRRGGAKVAMH